MASGGCQLIEETIASLCQALQPKPGPSARVKVDRALNSRAADSESDAENPVSRRHGSRTVISESVPQEVELYDEPEALQEQPCV